MPPEGEHEQGPQQEPHHEPLIIPETVAEVEEIGPPGQLDPNHIHTPGIYVNRLIAGTFTKRIEKLTVRE